MVPGVSASEVLMILLVVLLVLGPKSIPNAARQMGKWTSAARRAWDDIQKELRS